jgi:hypothetical protein
VPAAVYEHCILEKGIVDTMCSVVLWNIAGGAAACSGSMLPAVRFAVASRQFGEDYPAAMSFSRVGRVISLREHFLRTDALTGRQV